MFWKEFNNCTGNWLKCKTSELQLWQLFPKFNIWTPQIVIVHVIKFGKKKKKEEKKEKPIGMNVEIPHWVVDSQL